MSKAVLGIGAVVLSATAGIVAALALPSMNVREAPQSGSVPVQMGRSLVTYVGVNPELEGEYILEENKLFQNGEPVAAVINMYENGELYESNVYRKGSFAGKLRDNEWID